MALRSPPLRWTYAYPTLHDISLTYVVHPNPVIVTTRGTGAHDCDNHGVGREGTVKTHINHVFTKLSLRDRAAAVVFAFDHHLVSRAR